MEGIISSVAYGLGVVLTPMGLLYLVIGNIAGFIGGALPGISVTTTLALLLPFTYAMSAEHAVILLTSALLATGAGNSVPAILIRTPGTPSAVLSVVEGYQMHMRGESAKALGMALFGAVVGQALSLIALITLVIPLARIGLYFLTPEIFALCLLGLAAVSSVTGKNVFKGLAAAAFGVLLTTIGVDPVTGVTRFSFGNIDLGWGLPLIPVILGLLAVSEVFRASRQMVTWEKVRGKIKTELPNWSEIKECTPGMIIGTISGIIIGMLPGAGGTIASFIAYQQTKNISKHPERFGKGSLEALATNETAQNAAYGGELIPTLALGIPGAAGMALIMAALIIHGMQPGPLLMDRNPEIVNTFFGAAIAATVVMAVLGYLMIRPSIYIATLSRPIVVVATLALATLGVYSLRAYIWDVYVAYAFGFIGYLMYRYGYPPAATVLGFVLGTLIEASLRRGLVMSYGDWGVFLSRPMTLALLIFAMLTLLFPVFQGLWRRRRAGAAERPVAQVDMMEDP